MHGCDTQAAVHHNRRQMQAVRAFMLADSRKAEDWFFEVYIKHGGMRAMRHALDNKKSWL